MDADADIPTPTSNHLELAPRVRVPPDVVRFRYVRSRGPGGQNVNKVSSACELRVWIADLAPHLTPGAFARLRDSLGSRLTEAGEIQIVSDEARSQEQNRGRVLERLRTLLVAAMVEPKRRRATKPSRGAQQRRLQNKKLRSAVKSSRAGRTRDD